MNPTSREDALKSFHVHFLHMETSSHLLSLGQGHAGSAAPLLNPSTQDLTLNPFPRPEPLPGPEDRMGSCFWSSVPYDTICLMSRDPR